MFYNGSFPLLIASRVGFQGCLANVDINGKLINLNKPGADKNGNVQSGCKGSLAYIYSTILCMLMAIHRTTYHLTLFGSGTSATSIIDGSGFPRVRKRRNYVHVYG